MAASNRELIPTAEIATRLAPGWQYDADAKSIVKEFRRKDFSDSATFIQAIADVANQHDHHPDLLLHNYKNVRVMLSTHSAGGVTQKDLDLAREIDRLHSQ